MTKISLPHTPGIIITTNFEEKKLWKSIKDKISQEDEKIEKETGKKFGSEENISCFFKIWCASFYARYA